MQATTPVLAKAFEAVRKAERVLLVADAQPDGDSIGSLTAILNWLLREGKRVEAFSITPIPKSLLFLDQVQRITSDPEIFRQPFDCIVTFDTSDPKRCGITEYRAWIPTANTLVMFDHHATNERFGDLNVLDTAACSTCEVVYRFFEENRVAIDDRMATSLLSGILTDTSCFSNSGTTPKGIEAAGALTARGARHGEIMRKLFRNKSVDALKLWGLALSRLHYHPEHDCAATYFLQDDLKGLGTNDDAIDGLSNFLIGSCGSHDTILVLRELPEGKVKGSLRSISRDISTIAQRYGGGGHKKAAGFVVDGRIAVENGVARVV
jgi:phosphoesterase RecJ-like protein